MWIYRNPVFDKLYIIIKVTTSEFFLDKSGNESTKSTRIKMLAIEIFKTVNELNPNLMKTILTSKTNSKVWPFDLLVYCNTEKHWKAVKISWH